MRSWTARELFWLYAALLAAVAFAALLPWPGRQVQDERRSLWGGWAAGVSGTGVSFHGADPRRLAPPLSGPADAFFYGPLDVGECLAPIDMVHYEPRFDFLGFRTVLNVGVARSGGLRTLATLSSAEELAASGATHVQVCFPGGLDHEQIMWLGQRPGARAASPFGERLGPPPPPLRRQPNPLSADLGRLPSGLVRVHGRSVFSALGTEFDFVLADAKPIVVEFGTFVEWEFRERARIAVAAGERRASPSVPEERYFRIRLPEGGAGARFRLAPAEQEG